MGNGNQALSGIVPARNEYFVFADDTDDLKEFTGSSVYYNTRLQKQVSDVGLTSRYILCTNGNDLVGARFDPKHVTITEKFLKNRSKKILDPIKALLKLKGMEILTNEDLKLLPETLQELIVNSE